jgi:hypothetical protein
MPTNTSDSEELVYTHELRPISSPGLWMSNDRRYRHWAHTQLGQLVTLCEKLNDIWPMPGKAIKVKDASAELMTMIGQRDRLSDSTRIFCSMAVEGFINFYGVLRLGEECFNEHFERLGLVPKVRSILLFCDKLVIHRSAPIINLLDKVAQDRNRLVHPKTREIEIGTISGRKWGDPTPETAINTVKNMEAFFAEFLFLVPDARFHIAHPYQATGSSEQSLEFSSPRVSL